MNIGVWSGDVLMSQLLHFTKSADGAVLDEPKSTSYASRMIKY